MSGEKELDKLVKTMRPVLNEGDYVFCTVTSLEQVSNTELLMTFKEKEGYTLILTKETADKLQLSYSFVAAWITLTVHSSLEAVGFTAVFSKALGEANISCNVIAAYYHDHVFVNKNDAVKAMTVLKQLAG